MTDPRDLIEAATPLPWSQIGQRITKGLYSIARAESDGGDPINGELTDEQQEMEELANAALIVYAVNHLPALLDVAEAAKALSEALLPYGTQGRYHAPLEPIAKMRRALARLQESHDD